MLCKTSVVKKVFHQGIARLIRHFASAIYNLYHYYTTGYKTFFSEVYKSPQSVQRACCDTALVFSNITAYMS